ncbi:hypothetical protein BGZ51_001399 [Haplosporangium sp. Z 767]|nr:hypothetical protein BGZ50_009247 [Haplosporangium sp. Z 11]KAF9194054.1 hypothetical protein BGZ51_001399 [Haplosporangium sp. Z 767]
MSPSSLNTAETENASNAKKRGGVRRHSLSRFQVASSSLRFLNDALTATCIPNMWQCRDLRILNIGFDYINHKSIRLEHFTGYVTGHRLFRNLAMLKINIETLAIGKRTLSREPNPEKDQDGDINSQESFFKSNDEKYERYHNDLKTFWGLHFLELLSIRAFRFVGAVYSSKFEFLRLKSTKTVAFFTPNIDR